MFIVYPNYLVFAVISDPVINCTFHIIFYYKNVDYGGVWTQSGAKSSIKIVSKY